MSNKEKSTEKAEKEQAEKEQAEKEQAEETKNLNSFVESIKAVGSKIKTDTATKIVEGNTSKTYTLGEFKAVNECSLIDKFTIDKSKNALSVVFSPAFKVGLMADIHNFSVAGIEQKIFDNRNDVVFNLALIKISAELLTNERKVMSYMNKNKSIAYAE